MKSLSRACVAAAALAAAAPQAAAQSAPAQAAPAAAPAAIPPAAPVAPSETVTVRILAKGTGRPMKRVEVKVPGGQKQYTDKNGQLRFDVPSGSGSVELYRPGYETTSVSYADLRGKGGPVELYMFPAPPSDNEVIVKGVKRPEVSRKTVNIQEATKVAPGGDPAQVPKLLPGVQSKGFSPEIVVRGSGPNDSLYLIDNWEVPYIFHRIGSISVIPEQLLSDVEFSSGGFGTQYGGITGGVVALRTKNEIPENPRTEIKINVPLYSSIYHERPVNDGKDMLAVSARRSYIDAFLQPILKRSGADATLIPYFGDEHAYYVHPTDDGYFKVLAMHNYDGLHAAFASDASQDESGRANFDLLDQVEMIGAEWQKSVGSGWTMTLSPEIANEKSNIDVIDNHINIGAQSFRVVGEGTKRLDGKDKLYVGLDTTYVQAHADVLAPRPDPDDPFFDFEEAPKVQTRINKGFGTAAGWIATDQNFGPLMLTPGLRAFYTSQIKRSGADPRLSARYQLNKDNALKAAVGQYSETPQFQDTDTVFGNPDLKFIRSYHYVLGVETNWSDRWTTDFQLFHKETKDLVRSDPDTVKNNAGSQTSSGFEAFIRRNLTERIFGWLSYTYSKTRERDADGESYHEGEYDQTHVLNLAGNYKLTALWDLGGRFIYHTGDTTTPVDDAVYNANLDKYQARSDPGKKPYSERLPAYHELDIYADKDWLYDAWKLTLRFGVEYLALERQAQSVQYNYDYSKKDYFRGIPPIPYVEVKGTL